MNRMLVKFLHIPLHVLCLSRYIAVLQLKDASTMRLSKNSLPSIIFKIDEEESGVSEHWSSPVTLDFGAGSLNSGIWLALTCGSISSCDTPCNKELFSVPSFV